MYVDRERAKLLGADRAGEVSMDCACDLKLSISFHAYKDDIIYMYT